MTQQPQAKHRKDYKAPDFTITHLDLDFDLQASHTQVIAKSRVKQQVIGSDSMFLDGDGLSLKRVEINGEAWPHFEETPEGLVLTQLPTEFELLIETHIDPAANSSLEGLYLSDGAYCTQCEAEGFRRITYYLDRPDVLAKFTTKIAADKSAFPFLLSNGNKVGSGELESGRHWVQWEDPYAKPSYLFALVAGDFDRLADSFTTRSGRDVALEIFVDKGNLDRATHAMTSLKNSMKWDEDRFDLEYDLDIYMIVAVDFFNMGAMENKGLNVFNSKYVLANSDTATDTDYLGIEAVIGHEYFHNWTGNRVTCRDWFQLSLKEGLTVFRDQEFSSDLGSRAVNRIGNVRTMRGPQFAEDRSPMAHPIRPDKVIEMNNFYTLTVYEKGSEVIRMMHTLLGEVKFQKGIKLYFERHDGTAATCEDFVKAMEDASGIDLKQFRLWYSQSGTPVLDVTSVYDDESNTLTLRVKQHTPSTADQKDKQPLMIPFDVELYASDGNVIELQCNGEVVSNVLHVAESEQTFVFDNVGEQPVISMLREFSAPVTLHYAYSDEELAFLMVHARNEFARWDAGQMLLAKHIKANVIRVQAGEAVHIPEEVVDAFRGVLLSDQLDAALIAEVMQLPSENEIGGWFDVVDVDAINAVRGATKQHFANELADEFSAIYHSLKQMEYSIAHDAIGQRSLRNMCLAYLALTEQGDDIVSAHYTDSNNMTDTAAALAAANHAELASRAALMQAFSDKWQHDGLVMDKWFMLQGGNPAQGALDNVKAQMSHPAFSLKNPNRTRSLVGAFCNNNPVNFHAKDGAGYEFLSDILIQLNESNPQVASRLIDPLLKFKRFDQDRQALMRDQLERLALLDNLAKDLYEKINKALEV
ncbi:aminopeptidase N [Enterovibrio norvegicus FF-162]|uniref:aminopeptidase N n=1 Tax=Enterovibrio norvegicus TaxID=188144 RepID=UPI0002E942B8|nr:aminopeptidase N [Enterovibrio norvegicus]OEE89170.1 aminopeptidase N [Enterovibrio norvegicus FF-162]